MANRITNKKIYTNWEDLNINWEDLNMTWEEIFTIFEIISKAGGSGWGSEQFKNNPWKRLVEEVNTETAKNFLKIVCTVNGIPYESIKEKKIENLKISVEKIEKTLNEKLKINIKI